MAQKNDNTWPQPLLVIFDLDGTLLDSERVVQRVVQRVVERRGKRYTAGAHGREWAWPREAVTA